MILRCQTCVLRPFVSADAPALAAHANDRDVWRNLRDRFPHPYTPADAERYIAHVAAQAPCTSFAVDVGGEAVGSVGLELGDDIARRSAEIGYGWARPTGGAGSCVRRLRR